MLVRRSITIAVRAVRLTVDPRLTGGLRAYEPKGLPCLAVGPTANPSTIIAWLLFCCVLFLIPNCAPAQIRPREKDAAATKRVPASFGRFAIWLDPSKWKCVEDRPGRQLIQDLNGGLQIEMISEGKPGTTTEFKQSQLDEYRKIDPRAAIVDSEARTISGHEVLFAEFQYSLDGVPRLAYGVLYGGSSGTIRITFNAVKHIPGANRRDIERLLTGLEIRDSETTH